MRRKSGEPYILHPLAVAMICGWRDRPGRSQYDLRIDAWYCWRYRLLPSKMFKENLESGIAKNRWGLTKISNVLDANTLNRRRISKDITDAYGWPKGHLKKTGRQAHNMRTLDSMKRENSWKLRLKQFIYMPTCTQNGALQHKNWNGNLDMKYMEPDSYHYIRAKNMDIQKENGPPFISTNL